MRGPLAPCAAKEVGVDCTLDLEVEYDDAGARTVQRYRAVGTELQAASMAMHEGALLRPGCAYVVSGGLGGLGVAVVRLLLGDEASEGCSVLVVGRRAVSQGKRRLKELGWGERVAYACVDLGTDYKALRTALVGLLRRSGRPLAGIFHLAGSYSRVAVADLSVSALADATRAKVWGGDTPAPRRRRSGLSPRVRPLWLGRHRLRWDRTRRIRGSERVPRMVCQLAA